MIHVPIVISSNYFRSTEIFIKGESALSNASMAQISITEGQGYINSSCTAFQFAHTCCFTCANQLQHILVHFLSVLQNTADNSLYIENGVHVGYFTPRSGCF